MIMESEQQQQQPPPPKPSPRKHSTISTSSIKSNPSQLFSTIFIDPRLIPKNLFKFHKVSTNDDERLAMLERFRNEGIDPKKLNDSKKLPHVWRWLVDAEINCQSLRHQLEKLRIQHDHELQEVEDYVGHVWKLSMDRLSALQEENQFLYSKLNQNEVDIQYSHHSHDLNHNNLQHYDHDDDNNNKDRREIAHDRYPNMDGRISSRLLVDTMINPNRVAWRASNRHHPNSNLMIPHSLSTSSLSPASSCYSSNVITTILHGNRNRSHLKRSTSCLDLNNRHESTIFAKSDSGCADCKKLDCQVKKLQRQLLDVGQQLDKCEDQNSVMKKLNRYIEIENENFAYKLSECETQSNQLEQRVFELEQELRARKLDLTKANAKIDQQTRKINEQNRLINELNEKIKRLEEISDLKQMALEDAEIKWSKMLKKSSNKTTSWSPSSSSSWFRRKSDSDNNSNRSNNSSNPCCHPNQRITTTYDDNHDDYNDGFEEIKL